MAFNYVHLYYGCTVEETAYEQQRCRDGYEDARAFYIPEAKRLGWVPLDATGAVAVEVNRQRRGR